MDRLGVVKDIVLIQTKELNELMKNVNMMNVKQVKKNEKRSSSYFQGKSSLERRGGHFTCHRICTI